MASLAACTIVPKAHLALARVIAESFGQFHGDVPFFVLVVDEAEAFFDPSREDFHCLRLEDLDVPHLVHFRFGHTAQELTYASTPFLLRALLERGFDRVVFLKEESLVVGDLGPILDETRDAAIALTPHFVQPLDREDRVQRELTILRAGVYNAGFLAVGRRPSSRRFLDWWQDRLRWHCELGVEDGLHSV